jgi:hypothetical protein
MERPTKPSVKELVELLRTARQELERADPDQKALWERHISTLEKTLTELKAGK